MGEYGKVRRAIYATASEMGWTIIEETPQFDRGGRWSIVVTVHTDMGMGQFTARSDSDTVSLYSLWLGGFDDITVPREQFCAEVSR